MRCDGNHADLTVIPSSRANCWLLTPFLLLVIRRIAAIQCRTGIFDSSSMVPSAGVWFNHPPVRIPRLVGAESPSRGGKPSVPGGI